MSSFVADKYNIINSYKPDLEVVGDYKIIENTLTQIKPEIPVLRVPDGVINISADYKVCKEVDFSNCTTFPLTSGEEYNTTHKIANFICNKNHISLPKDFMRGEITLESISNCEALEVVGKSCFSGCTTLKNISQLPNIRVINNHAFLNCNNLQELCLGSNLEVVGKKSFQSTRLKHIKLQGTLKEVPEGCFNYCKELEQVYLADTIERISYWAFHCCKELKVINFPINLESIGGSAFSGCSSLRHVQLPYGLRTIGAYAFQGTAITKMVIPKTVVFMGKGCFDDCNALQEIHLPKHLLPFKWRIGIPNHVKVYVTK